MAGGFDFEMNDLGGRRFPEYDTMDNDQLNIEYNTLTNERLDLLRNDDPSRLEEVKDRLSDVDRLQSTREDETVFTDDGKTVTITRKGQRSHSAPLVEFVDTTKAGAGNNRVSAVEAFISRVFKIDSYRLSRHGTNAMDLRLNIDITGNNHITYRPLTARNERGVARIVLKRDSNGVLHYNDAKVTARAVNQFKRLIEDVVNEQADREKIVRGMPMVDTTLEHQDEIPGLTPKENSEMRGVLTPSASLDPRTRKQALQTQADHFQVTINKTIDQYDNEDNTSLTRFELDERVIGLREAKDLTNSQIEKEDIREQQEEDISRLQKFKEWAKENIAGLSALTISVAGIITTIVIGARSAIAKGAQATSKFAKAVANLAKKVWPLLGPLLNILAQAISWGAKGLAWLASNLWVLAIAFTWFIYDQYKQAK